ATSAAECVGSTACLILCRVSCVADSIGSRVIRSLLLEHVRRLVREQLNAIGSLWLVLPVSEVYVLFVCKSVGLQFPGREGRARSGMQTNRAEVCTEGCLHLLA